MIGCLIIHGFTGSSHEVNPLVVFLKENTNWHLEVPVLPGHGRKLALENISYQSWIDTSENVLKDMQKKCTVIYVIGFSMGGMIASYLAAKHKVDKLVLLAASGKFISYRQIFRDVRGVMTDGIRGKLEENKLYTQYKTKLKTVPLKANLEFLKLVKYTRPYLKDVETPVLIAQGRQDNMVPYKTAYYLDKKITSVQKEVVFFERSRHQICLGTDKDTLNQMIYQFLIKEMR